MIRYGILLLLFLSAASTAETVYIHDVLYVPLRGGPSSEHRIVNRGLRSGTQLELLETSTESGFSHVRLQDGTEGWLPSQYLVAEPIASERLQVANDRIAALEAEHQQTLLRLRELREENQRLSTANAELSDSLETLQVLSADVVAINDENVQLKDEVEVNNEQLNALLARNATLESSTSREWFLAGGGTVLIGLLFGFWLGRRLYHKRNTGGWA